jgi:hypothetical protein
MKAGKPWWYDKQAVTGAVVFTKTAEMLAS